MKIVFLLPSLYGGGAERVVLKLADTLSLEHQVSLILLESGGRLKTNTRYPLKFLSNIDGKYSSSLEKLLKAPVQFLRFKYLLYKNKPEVIVSFLDRPNVMNLIGFRGRAKKVISIRSHLTSKLKSSSWGGVALKLCYRVLLARAGAIVVPSNVMKDDLIRNFFVSSEKVHVIPNGYNFDLIGQLGKAALPIVENELFTGKTILTVGSLSKAKRQDILVQAFAKVATSLSVKLVVIGEGDELDGLTRLARKQSLNVWRYDSGLPLTLSFDVYFMGYKDNPFPYMAKCDVFALSSEREGFPNVLVEALYWNKKIVSTDCSSGPKEILQPQGHKTDTVFGTLVPSPAEHEDSLVVSELGRQLKTALEDQNINSESLRARSLDYSNQSFIRSWEELIGVE